ncbi:MAG: NADH-dependent [FeFe] hydrogenase, group A6 [Clostridia bacterium]
MVQNNLTIDNLEVSIESEKNLLEVIRKANIDLPTFCYHSEMSIYGACRLCMVDIEGRGLQPACSIKPEPEMIVKTNTKEVREMRKMIVELLLADHDVSCPTCDKTNSCQLQSLAQQLGLKKVRFEKTRTDKPLDLSSTSLVRDPNKCVLCGDCVRMCNEIQKIGAIDFAYRGASSTVTPSFNKDLNQVECVYCGQCVRVCPTGALMPKNDIEYVWQALDDKNKYVVAQIAPAVRVSLGEAFGLEAGKITTGQMIEALRRMGFDQVYDTSFAADLTIIEEGNELINRLEKQENLPLFTSCCPAWVKYMEQYHPELIENLSSCKSPQQMLGSLVKEKHLKHSKDEKEIVMVSIMPCTAKKFEAARDEFISQSGPDVDHVITTIELATMIKEMGLDFSKLNVDSFDLPFGFKTGGGVIFGNSGGVTEAVLRFAGDTLSGKEDEEYIYTKARGKDGIRELELVVNNQKLKFAIVHGLGNAKELLKQVVSGEKSYHFIEVMSCPGGCVNGGGQPVTKDLDFVDKRANGLYDSDKMLQLHKAQQNPYIKNLYKDSLEEPGGKKAHDLLHTKYHHRKRIKVSDIALNEHEDNKQLSVTICFGTSCYLKGAESIFRSVKEYVESNSLEDIVNLKATFCYEKCEKGPVVKIGERIIQKCDEKKALLEIKNYFS